jgi:Protein of unknown function (DUF642)
MKPSHILTVACLILGGEARAAELIVNGGFEQPSISGSYQTFINGVPGWYLSHDIDMLNQANGAWPAYEGAQSIDLSGTSSSGAYIEQTFATLPSHAYRLAFHYANNLNVLAASGAVRVTGSNLLVEADLGHSSSSPASMNFTLFETNFIADAPQTTLRLTHLLQTGSGLILDAVSVTPIFCTPHRATAVPALVNGFVVGATITDGGCGYSNAPLVLIQGGSGAGATATATVNNGRVTAINITGAGIGYTTKPTVGIRFSKVEVTQHVTLGRNYVLESSSDLATWSATGQAFTAASENYTHEFVVGQTGQFFRLREVP